MDPEDMLKWMYTTLIADWIIPSAEIVIRAIRLLLLKTENRVEA